MSAVDLLNKFTH